VAMDRGDIDDQVRFPRHQEGRYFVTRQKGKAHVQVTARCAVARSTGGVADHDGLRSRPTGQAYPARRRHVRDREAATGHRDVVWTKALHWAAPTSAAMYPQRGPVELCCKAMTQNLRLNTCLGTSEHAVMPQVWVVLITDLLLACLRFQAGLGMSFQQMGRLLHINLFARRNLRALCSPPPPDVLGSQL
jgi:hypothetical protein